jgi:hypothetical protein
VDVKKSLLTVDVKVSDFEEVKALLLKQQEEIEDLKSALASIQHYAADKKSLYMDRVYEYARRARHGEKLKKYEGKK